MEKGVHSLNRDLGEVLGRLAGALDTYLEIAFIPEAQTFS
jgi:hypothetical protein